MEDLNTLQFDAPTEMAAYVWSDIHYHFESDNFNVSANQFSGPSHQEENLTWRELETEILNQPLMITDQTQDLPILSDRYLWPVPNVTKFSYILEDGKRIWPCLYCGKKCARKPDLESHMRVHTKEKPFRCNFDGCGRSFARSSSIRHHERHFHRIPTKTVPRQNSSPRHFAHAL
eukprot:TRINITY_DN4125_c0_g1_i1.p1 TRINITY_DN4125_c0_g1~~TRINITY_DN4125_c0_g1_i1.p1  ORF type:complete len:175 (-),score=16.27 TRINITY_DN4125_c0_g1_i1:22-546(-)